MGLLGVEIPVASLALGLRGGRERGRKGRKGEVEFGGWGSAANIGIDEEVDK